jgi:hypothetical protein
MYTRERDSDAVRGGSGGGGSAKLAKRNPLPSYIFIITRALLRTILNSLVDIARLHLACTLPCEIIFIMPLDIV